MTSFQVLLERFPPNPAMVSRQNHHHRHLPPRIPVSSTATVTPPPLLDDFSTWRVTNPVNTERYRNASSSKTISNKTHTLVHKIDQQNPGHMREYETLRLLGHGTFGVVFKIKEQCSGVEKAIKIIGKESMLKDYDFRMELLQREICIQRWCVIPCVLFWDDWSQDLSFPFLLLMYYFSLIFPSTLVFSLDHDHIVCLFDHWEDEKNYYLILEYAIFGDLESYRRKHCISRHKRVSFIHQITSALEHLSFHRIAHRDIKGENVLVYEHDVVKLADFGWAIQLSDGDYQRSTLCGTPEFVSPEMIVGRGSYDARHVDQWSLGVFTWELMQDHGLFDFSCVKIEDHTTEGNAGLRPRDVVFSVIKNFVELDVTMADDAQVGDFCSKLIVRNPRRRMTCAQALSHPFLGGLQRVTKEEVRSSGNKRLRLS